MFLAGFISFSHAESNRLQNFSSTTELCACNCEALCLGKLQKKCCISDNLILLSEDEEEWKLNESSPLSNRTHVFARVLLISAAFGWCFGGRKHKQRVTFCPDSTSARTPLKLEPCYL